jgi:hypothetical protein
MRRFLYRIATISFSVFAVITPRLSLAVLFTSDTLITANDTSFDGQDITISNCMVVVDGMHSFNNLQLQPNGILTHSPSNFLFLLITNDVHLFSGASLTASGKGFSGNAGPGGGVTVTTNFPYAYTAGAGGAYGGSGGSSSSGASGRLGYGSLFTPDLPGSGGGLGGAGGGAIHLQIGGTLIVDGSLSADGADGTNSHSGGGSGGSLWIAVPNLQGSGTISASGGSGEPFDGGGGGGGRIAIYCETNSFFGQMRAFGAAGFTYGGAGTLYLATNGLNIGELIINNGTHAGTNTVINVTNKVNLTITANAIACASGGLVTLSNLLIESNSWYTLAPGQTVGRLTVSGCAVLEKTSGILATGVSYDGGGKGGVNPFSGGGGGHAGFGGSGYGGSAGGAAYDSPIQPVLPGSAGGGLGGGAIQMDVSKTLKIDGQLACDGAAGSISTGGSGGGSGGSIWLNVGTLSGEGIISAAGGAAPSGRGGGGGGGRIAVHYATNDFSGVFRIQGGAGYNYGGAGTLSLQASNSSIPQVTVDNGGARGTNTSLKNPGFVDLFVKGGAAVQILANLQSLLLESNSFLITGPDSTVFIAADASLEKGSAILVSPGSGLGYSQGGTVSTFGGGGGNGGAGGAGTNNAPGGPPSIEAMDRGHQFAGKGGNGSGGVGGFAGGALYLNVNGTFYHEGMISSDGGPGSGLGSGGGAGGSIYISAGRLLGSGSISANGGPSSSPTGGGGGGGRIYIYSQTNGFAGHVSTYGGSGFVYGGAGTIYQQLSLTYFPLVMLDNAGNLGAPTALTSAERNYDLVVAGSAQAGFLFSAGGPPTLRNVTIRADSSLAPLLFTTTESIAWQCTSLNIQTNGAITLNGFSSRFSTTPGAGQSGFVAGGGGGHGGSGGSGADPFTGAFPRGGIAFDYIVSPTNAGANGANGSTQTKGGGALKLVAQDLVLDGRITANGNSATNDFGGGGAGGSIWLISSNFSGAGAIIANGGAGGPLGGGGGGGGRLALYTASSSFTGSFSASGGLGIFNGGAGTIFTKLSNSPVASLVIDNHGIRGTNTPIDLSVLANLTVQNGGVATPTSGALVFSNVSLLPAGLLTCLASQSNLEVTALGDALIQTNGAISVALQGYSGTNSGPGAGQFNISGAGGSHGGTGGASRSGALPGPTYDSAQRPAARGSAGGVPVTNVNSSQGGGAVRLFVAGNLIINGELSADGAPGLIDRSGGGAGGSLLVAARSLYGNGLITASGGAGEPFDGGGGGGGRVAIYAGSNNFTGPINVSGGSGAAPGEPGSIAFSSESLTPEVISISPTGSVTSALSILDVSFDTPLESNSLTPDSARLVTPNGIVLPTNFTFLSLSKIRFMFPPQDSPGLYQFSIGPQVVSLIGAYMSQAYTGTIVLSSPIISGTIVDTDGVPMAGVTVHATDGLPAVLTDAQGYYELPVLPGFQGTASPLAPAGFSSIPNSRSYLGVASSISNQNYKITSSANLVISSSLDGNIFTLTWPAVPNVTYEVSYSYDLSIWSSYATIYPNSFNSQVTLQLPFNYSVQFPKVFWRFKPLYFGE